MPVERSLGRPGLRVEITLGSEQLTALQGRKTIEPLHRGRHLATLRFDGGAPFRAAFRVRGKSSLQRAFQLRRPRRQSFTIDLRQAVPFLPGLSLRRLYLLNQIYDPHYFEMRFSYLLLSELGLFPAHHQFVSVVVNGEPQGLYLLVERPRDAILRTRPAVTAIYQRTYFESLARGHYEPRFARWSGAGQELIERLKRAVDRLEGRELEEELDAVIDLDGYLRWLGFNSLVRNADSYDELLLHVLPTRRHPAGRLELMAWDYDDIMRERPAHPRLALDDPLLFAAEAALDRRIRTEPRLYGRYRRILEAMLRGPLDAARLRDTVDRVRREVDDLDLGPEEGVQPGQIGERRGHLEIFEGALLERRRELLGLLAEPLETSSGGPS